MRRLGCQFFCGWRKISGMILVSLVCVANFTGFIGNVYAAALEGGRIPDESIRIRILAHSDSAYDQEIKRAVRGRVEDVILSWGPMPDTYEEARALVSAHLGEIQEAADQALAERGAPYAAAVELGTFAFPAKTFAGEYYEAGEYEALRITLGEGRGSNWWCVLFPPLCITAAVAPDPEEAKGAAGKAAAGGPSEEDGAAGDERPKPRFFLWEMLKKLAHWLGGLFA